MSEIKSTDTLRPGPGPAARAWAWAWPGLALLLWLAGGALARAGGLSVSLPNGYATLSADDLRVYSTARTVRWRREWDGHEWMFNPHWESLSQSWRNLTGSQTADADGTASAGPSAPAGECWVRVDDGWLPPPGGGAASPERMAPFNRAMDAAGGGYPAPVRVAVDYASLCAGTFQSGAVREREGIRRQHGLYLGEGGRYAFSNRDTLDQRPVRALPPQPAAALDADLADGSLAQAPAGLPQGFRWQDRGGDWIDYDAQGRAVAYGDRNGGTVWLARDSEGRLRGVADGEGRVLLTLHYTGSLVTEVRDAPQPGNPLDLPARSVHYQYDGNNRLVQFTDVRGGTTRYGYDGQGHLDTITDPEGRVERIAYTGDMVRQRTAPDGTVTDYAFGFDDAHKQFASRTTGPATPAGRRVEEHTHNRTAQLVRRTVNGRAEESVSYDSGARTETRTDARGFATRFTKNEFGQIVQIDQPDGTTVKRAYSALHLRLTEETDEADIKTQYQYDAQGNLLKTTEAAGTADERVTEYQVNSLGQTVKLTRKGRTEADGSATPDAVWQMEYDATGQVGKATDPEGGVRQYTHDRAGHLVRAVDPLGHATRYETDADGNLVRLTDALGRVQAFAYDKAGNLTARTDARGQQTLAAYDAMDRLVRTTNPVGGVHTLQYNGEGLPVSETDEDGLVRQAGYDNFLRLARQSDGLGNAVEYGYDLPDGTPATDGPPAETRYPTHTRQDRYDSRGRPAASTQAVPTAQGLDTRVRSAAYDPRGLPLSETDADGHVRSHRYDSLGQRVETTDALGHKTAFRYDARGNLAQVDDANGHSRRFRHDRAGRLTEEILPLGQTTRYRYDAAGRPVEKTGPDGTKTVYAYDDAGRLAELKQYTADGAPLRSTAFTWDETDRLTAWADADHARNLAASGSAAYDAAGRKTAETVTWPDGHSLGYGYGYSKAGRKTRLTWPDGTPIDYAYSAHGELESISIPGEGILSVNQYHWLAAAKATLPGGTVQEKGHDGLLQLESLKVKTSGQQTVLELANAYGKERQLNTRSRADGGGAEETARFGYDAEQRLAQADTATGGVPTETETFGLDPLGNRTAHSRVQGQWEYDANNRLIRRGTGVNATFYSYDDAGNLVQKAGPGRTTRYSYDGHNRLAEASDGAGNLVARYGYDPFGRRIWKEAYPPLPEGEGRGEGLRTYYLYSDEGLLAEATLDVLPPLPSGEGWGEGINAAAPQLAVQYGPRPNAPFTTAVLFVKTQDGQGRDAFAYYHHDHLGTPLLATGKGGDIVWSARYNAYGQAEVAAPAAGQPAITSNLRLPGQYFDAETGLHYNYHRYYDPESGRYTTEDPVGLAGGVNVYGYVRNNPLNRIDTLGLFDTIEQAGKAGSCAINPKSKNDNQEYSGAVYKNGPNDYQYTDPLPGEPAKAPTDGFNVPEGAEIVAYYHTHAAYDPSLKDRIDGVDRNTNFSYKIDPDTHQPDGDIPYSDELDKPNIMADPFDDVHEYIPKSYNPKAPKKDRQKQRKGMPLGKCGCD